MTESPSVSAWLQEATSNRSIRERLRATLAPYNVSEQTADALVYQLIGGVSTATEAGVINLGYCPDTRTRTPELLTFLAGASDGSQYTNAAATLSYTGLFGRVDGEDGFNPGVLLNPETDHVYLDNSPCLNDRAVRALPQVVSTQTYSVTLHDTSETIENDVSLTLVSPTSRGRKPEEDFQTFLADTLGISTQLFAALDLTLYDDGLRVISNDDPLSEAEFREVIAAAQAVTPSIDTDAENRLDEHARELVRATGTDATVRRPLQKFAEASARLHLNETVEQADIEDAAALLTTALVSEAPEPPVTTPAEEDDVVEVTESVQSEPAHEGRVESEDTGKTEVIDPETGEIRTKTDVDDGIMVAEEGSSVPSVETSEEAPDKLQSFFEGAEQAEAEEEAAEQAEADSDPSGGGAIIEAGPGGATTVDNSTADTGNSAEPVADDSDIITDTGYGAVDLGTAATSTVESSLKDADGGARESQTVTREEDDHAIVEMKQAASPSVSGSDVETMADIVNSLGAHYDGCKVPGKVVFERAREEGLDIDEAAEALTQLTDSGEIVYYKRTGKFLSP